MIPISHYPPPYAPTLTCTTPRFWQVLAHALVLLVLPAGLSALSAQSKADSLGEFTENSIQQRAAIEVVELHTFLADWFSGRLAKSKAAFSRFEGAIATDFVIVGPDGSVATRNPVIKAVFDDWGRWREDSKAAIEIKNVVFRHQGTDLVIVTYEEWHRTAEGTRARSSSVVLRESDTSPAALQWVHLHETWLLPAINRDDSE